MSSPTEDEQATMDAAERDATREAVREKYASAARRSSRGGCGCGSADGDRDPVARDLYGDAESAELPEGALEASLGCGNPTALAELREGEVVLDLGSGGGADVLLSARRVAPGGRAYGVDMTDDMLELARRNAREAGVDNVEFRKGEIEDLPFEDEAVDVILSNCVINLSTDKPRVFSEAFRVLRPGGRLAVSDVVVQGEIPPRIRGSLEAWAGCMAGALEEEEYRRHLRNAGFRGVEIEVVREHEVEDARDQLLEAGLDPEAAAEAVEGRFVSAFIRARKARGPAPTR